MDLCQHCNKPVESQGFRPKKFCNDQCRYDFHNKKKKKWTLKKLAKHYQETGEYLPEAQRAEDEYIKSIMPKILEKYEKYKKEINICESEMALETMIDIEIGLWQADNGFYATWKAKWSDE